MTIAQHPIPLFSNPESATAFLEKTCKFDTQELWRGLEVVLLPGTEVAVTPIAHSKLCEIRTSAYPTTAPCYTLSAFLDRISDTEIPSPYVPLSLFLARIAECKNQKTPYLWGGNLPLGDSSLSVAIGSKKLSVPKKNLYSLKGVDCSGLIYWASMGMTGRNSSDLIRQGNPVCISRYSSQELANLLEPGMIIGWRGHVLVVVPNEIVESCAGKGVISTPVEKKVKELMETRSPLDAWPETKPEKDSFVVRDLRPLFHPEGLVCCNE